MPETIIVGITYPSGPKRPSSGALRLRDLTPTPNAQMDQRIDVDYGDRHDGLIRDHQKPELRPATVSLGRTRSGDARVVGQRLLSAGTTVFIQARKVTIKR
ncbi:hypothetical protein ACO2Q8_17270 [Larkinella sp. VNQ87]|uniref:hypothetical protein n=1 Tax=Larkinella sp. VNQ87 TaxID=3400921 RepID=UPI003C0031BA